MVYQDRIETNLLQQFAQQENPEWFSIISAIVFEVSIAAERKKNIGNDLLVFYKFHFPSAFILLPCPTVVLACLKRSMSEKEALLPSKHKF